MINQAIYAAQGAPQQLEQLYHEARSANAVAAFAASIHRCHAEFPDNLLYAAWHYRLLHDGRAANERSRLSWRTALPLSLLASAALFWLFGSFEALMVLFVPIAALWALGYLAFTGRVPARRAVVAGAVIAGLSIYVLLLAARLPPGDSRRYIDLALPHLALLGWGGVALGLLGPRSADTERLAFLSRSLAISSIAGVCLIISAIFIGITAEMFDALNMQFPGIYWGLIPAGAGGLALLVGAASAHNLPMGVNSHELRPVGKIAAIFLWALLLLTLAVLVIYVCAMPFHFMEPFRNRRMLVTSNTMLFAVMGLLISIALVRMDGLAPRYQAVLRAAIPAVATLTVIIGLYALAAIVYRTTSRRLTVNRLAGVGWNIINIGILMSLLYRQLRAGPKAWWEGLRSVFGAGVLIYVAWALVLMLALPVFFANR
jgi:hypothetical protein